MADQFQPPASAGMAQCEVTGKWVPAAETVVFQGKRVSLEGKERLVELLKSGDLLPGEMEKPTVIRRLGSAWVDRLILRMIGGAFVIVFGLGNVKNFFEPGEMGAFQVQFSFFTFFTYMAYFGLMHGLKGQSLGKMAGKMKVVNRDGSPINMTTAFLRAFYFSGVSLLECLGFVFLAGAESSETTITSVFQMVAALYAIINATFAYFDKAEQRALHDRLAGTRVIMDV